MLHMLRCLNSHICFFFWNSTRIGFFVEFVQWTNAYKRTTIRENVLCISSARDTTEGFLKPLGYHGNSIPRGLRVALKGFLLFGLSCKKLQSGVRGNILKRQLFLLRMQPCAWDELNPKNNPFRWFIEILVNWQIATGILARIAWHPCRNTFENVSIMIAITRIKVSLFGIKFNAVCHCVFSARRLNAHREINFHYISNWKEYDRTENLIEFMNERNFVWLRIKK